MKRPVKSSLAIVVCVTALLGCNSSNNTAESDTGSPVWTEQSEQIVLTRFNGHTVDDADRYSVYDFSRDTLTADALEQLKSIKTTTSDLGCSEDEQSYDVVVTDGSGLEQTFYSANKSCNNIEGDGFIALGQLNNFVESLSN